MSIPTGFFTDLTKNFYGIDPSSQSTEEVEVSEMLWKDFLSKVAGETDPYFTIISHRDEHVVRQSLVALASTYISPLSEKSLEDLGHLAHELAIRRPSLPNLTSKNAETVKALLRAILEPYPDTGDEFLTTILPSLAEDIAAANNEKEKLYLEYLSGRLDLTHAAEAINALSAQEISGRHLTYTLYDIILTLINVMSEAQLLEANAAMPLIRKKERYVEMMRKVFAYKGQGIVEKKLVNLLFRTSPFTFPLFQDSLSTKVEGKVIVGPSDWAFTKTSFSTNPEEYFLGYGNITLQDILNFLYSKSMDPASSGSESFTLSSTPLVTQIASTEVSYEQRDVKISVQKTPTGEYTVKTESSLTYKYLKPSGEWMEGGWGGLYQSTQVINPSSVSSLETAMKEALASTYYSVYSQLKTGNYAGVDPENPSAWWDSYPALKDVFGTNPVDLWKYAYLARAIEPKIPWPFSRDDEGNIFGVLMAQINPTGLSTEEKQTYELMVQNAGQLRYLRNKALSSCLDAIRSKMQVVSDKMDLQAQLEESSATGKKNTVEILQTILRQLQNMISSIYR